MKKTIHSKAATVISAILIGVLLVIGILELGLKMSLATRPWEPDYPKEDITPVLYKDSYSDEDYEFLYRQTGLGKIGIDELVSLGDYKKIITIHHQFFDKQNLTFDRFSVFAAVQRRSDTVTLHASLANGDILYSPSTYFSFAEIGHTAIVIDEENEIMAQASGYGTPLMNVDVRSFFARPMYVILRVNISEDERLGAVNFVNKNCLGAKYSIFAGLTEKESDGKMETTHCSHFIHAAYASVGIDLNTDGGKIIMPRDIFNSPNVSVVQVFGIDPYSEALFGRAL
jgi:uncharacterized protein YycO